MKELDVRHLACPGPVLTLREHLNQGEAVIRIHVADQLAHSNVTRFAVTRGATVESSPDDGDGFIIDITAGADSSSSQAGEESLLVCDVPAAPAGPTIVQVTTTAMGRGDDELGALLMRSFLKTQLQLEEKPDAVLFYNDGVKLCCRGSLLIGDLRALEDQGIEIIACGTCLNYFELADRLEVGRVTDMLEIATVLATAGRLVRP